MTQVYSPFIAKTCQSPHLRAFRSCSLFPILGWGSISHTIQPSHFPPLSVANNWKISCLNHLCFHPSHHSGFIPERKPSLPFLIFPHLLRLATGTSSPPLTLSPVSSIHYGLFLKDTIHYIIHLSCLPPSLWLTPVRYQHPTPSIGPVLSNSL